MESSGRSTKLTQNLLELFGDDAIDEIREEIANTLHVSDALEQLDECRKRLQQRGLKTGRDLLKAIHHAEATPVELAITDIYEYLKKGNPNDAIDALDGLVTALQNIISDPQNDRCRCLSITSSGFQRRLSARIGVDPLLRLFELLGFMHADNLLLLPAPEAKDELELQLNDLRHAVELICGKRRILNTSSSRGVSPSDAHASVEQERKELGEPLHSTLTAENPPLVQQVSSDPVPVTTAGSGAELIQDSSLAQGDATSSKISERTSSAAPSKPHLPGMDNPGPKPGRIMDMTVRTRTLEHMQSALRRRADALASKTDSLRSRETTGDWTKSRGVVAGSGEIIPKQKQSLGSKRNQSDPAFAPSTEPKKRVMTLADLRDDDDDHDEESKDGVGSTASRRANTDTWGSMEIPSHYSARLGGGGSSQTSSETTGNQNPDIARFRQLGREMLRLTNEHRSRHGLPPLVWDEDAAIVAAQHSRAMSLGKVAFGHDGFNRRVTAYEKRSHRSVTTSAENVAYASHGIAEYARVTVTGWINSPGHNKNLLSKTTRCGLGVYQGSDGLTYTTQLFFSP